jgi:hypothetical protein
MSISAVGSWSSQIQPQQVSPSALKSGDNDGDGRSGVAALNDGDAAAQQAALAATKSGSSVDVKA